MEATATLTVDAGAAAAPVVKADDEWRRQLNPLQYQVLRHKGTERAFTGEYWEHEGPGFLSLRRLRLELFRSEAQVRFRQLGWPSYQQPAVAEHVRGRRKTAPCSCGASKCAAPAARGTSATSSKTAPRRPASATA